MLMGRSSVLSLGFTADRTDRIHLFSALISQALCFEQAGLWCGCGLWIVARNFITAGIPSVIKNEIVSSTFYNLDSRVV
jgi:hypothetical protein